MSEHDESAAKSRKTRAPAKAASAPQPERTSIKTAVIVIHGVGEQHRKDSGY